MIDILYSYNDWGVFALRLVVALVFLYHAFPKLKMSQMMAQGMGWSAGAVKLLGIAEVVGALSVFSGIFFQWGALLLAVVMMGALYYKMKKWGVPFSSQQATGWEFDLVLLASTALFITGGPGSIVF